ncbi:phytanoyl-CoA dioxygenase family protein [Parasphingopyxis algicola]|uniref:phytanoyl-CoA dioxygenase family protein n=1 Tax=Parasphingopyxis algicola TaxID=2026624 RepID=UPI0015A44AE3|nr:phytanoyl-CoA dioxygenase family protein [Parasphingopyxis algicola]QLC26353.1 phytanoyl-CoA dioxygenase family protein [Parasphingopyxis algicola]
MPLNRHPLRPISEEDADIYARDGVVCLREVFDPEWMEMLAPFARRIIVDKEDFGLLPTTPRRYMARKIEEFRNFVFDSPLGEAVGNTLRSRWIRFYFDEIFAKPPRSDAVTKWHCDRMGWPVSGQMVPSVWIPLTPITTANSMECIAGSHRGDVPYWLFSANARRMIQPKDRPTHPDGEALRSDPRIRFLSWDMQPGDMLIIHPWCLHYSCGNPTDSWRLAVSMRVFGDDIRWDPRPDANNFAGISFDEMMKGLEPDGPLLPIIWSEDGNCDSAKNYPRGFATHWPKSLDRDRMLKETFNPPEFVNREPAGPSKIDIEPLLDSTSAQRGS